VARRLQAYVAVVVGALAAGVPVAMILRGLDTYIERQAIDEVRFAERGGRGQGAGCEARGARRGDEKYKRTLE